jgi:hypothetical protein
MMTLIRAAGLAFMLIGAPAVAAPPAPQPKAAVEAPAAVPENALRLSMLLNSTDQTVEAGLRGFRFGIDDALKKNPDDAAVYDRNPGLLDAVRDAGAEVTRRHLVAIMPAHQRRFAQFFAAKFSPSEIDDLVAFYSTPTGTKVIKTMYAGLDLAKLVESAEADGSKLSANNIREANKEAASKLPDLFDADDWKAIFVFSAKPVSAKLTGIGPELQQFAADMQNEPDPAFDAEMDAAVTAAVKAYMARKAAKTGS